MISPPKFLYHQLSEVPYTYHVGMFQMGVSKNNGTPKSYILIGFSIINHPFWGTPIFWKHPNLFKRPFVRSFDGPLPSWPMSRTCPPLWCQCLWSGGCSTELRWKGCFLCKMNGKRWVSFLISGFGTMDVMRSLELLWYSCILLITCSVHLLLLLYFTGVYFFKGNV